MKDFQLAPPDDPLYVVREADVEFEQAMQGGMRLILIRGSARTGKSALLARALKGLREQGQRVVLLDLNAAEAADLATLDGVCRWVAKRMATQLDLVDPFSGLTGPTQPGWDEQRSGITNLERYLRRHVLPETAGPLFLLWDAVERLLAGEWAEIFSLLKSWYHESALEPSSAMARIACVLAVTFDHVWVRREIRSLGDDGGFIIGTNIRPAGFKREEIEELNRRVGPVLRGAEALDRFERLLGGQPFLVRSGLEYLRSHGGGIAELEALADQSDAPWAEFLKWLGQECDAVPQVRQAMVELAMNLQPSDRNARWPAHALGLITDDRDKIRLRCDLYRRYFARRYGA